ncbi:uncharacterized protein LOC141901023 isoform X2 [Tubulanus polymorphus]|uniref:uncharacterized protein LOC141901023 isoform X2 n=1 Tax=Tubulanus polymorphus TaxID=672921 RepID=UPI003DA2673D
MNLGRTVIIMFRMMSIIYCSKSTVAENEFCKNGELEYNGFCYYFVNHPNNYDEAIKLCPMIIKGRTFAGPEDENEEAFMISEIVNRKWPSAWAGVRIQHGDWHWVQDNQFIAAQGCYEDDVRGSHMFPYKASIKNGTLTPIVCRKACRDLNFNYAGLQAGNECWCGAVIGNHGYSTIACNVSCDGDPKLLCGNLKRNYVYRLDGGYSSWEPGLINKWDSEPLCAVLSLPSYNWNDRLCQTEYLYICDLTVASSKCVHSDVGNFCLLISEDKKSWFKSRETCHSLGGRLLTIKSQNKQEIIAEFLKSRQVTVGPYWIGASNFNWTTWHGTPIIYTGEWAKGTWIMRYGGKARYVQMTVDSLNKTIWKLVPSTEVSYYICKRANTRKRPTTSTTTSATASNPKQNYSSWGVTLGLGISLGLMIIIFVVAAIAVFIYRERLLRLRQGEMRRQSANEDFVDSIETTSSTYPLT